MSYYGSDRSEVLPYYPDQSVSDVLDIGCAEGRHGELLLSRGVADRVSGIEFEPGAATVARQVLDAVHEGDAERVLGELPSASFDGAAALDVLEHMRDPWTALADLRRVLKPGGWVVASIPNVRFILVVADLLVRGRFDYTDSGILDRTHLRFFTRRSIQGMFAKAGYSDVRIVGLDHPSRRSWVRVASRLLGDLAHRQFIVIARSGGDAVKEGGSSSAA
jgi:SAM-dependent methyltransferase